MPLLHQMMFFTLQKDGWDYFLGSIYKCPGERYIPIFLITSGAIILFKHIINICVRCREGKDVERNIRRDPFYMMDYVINCFLIGWSIAGMTKKKRSMIDIFILPL